MLSIAIVLQKKGCRLQKFRALSKSRKMRVSKKAGDNKAKKSLTRLGSTNGAIRLQPGHVFFYLEVD